MSSSSSSSRRRASGPLSPSSMWPPGTSQQQGAAFLDSHRYPSRTRSFDTRIAPTTLSCFKSQPPASQRGSNEELRFRRAIGTQILPLNCTNVALLTTRVETMGLEPTTPCFQIVPARTSWDACGLISALLGRQRTVGSGSGWWTLGGRNSSGASVRPQPTALWRRALVRAGRAPLRGRSGLARLIQNRSLVPKNRASRRAVSALIRRFP